MAGKKVELIPQEDMPKWMDHLRIAKAEVRKAELVLSRAVKTYGGISHGGLHFYNTQSVKDSFDPKLVGESLDELGVRWQELAPEFPAALINKLVLQSAYGKDIRAMLKVHPSEGMITTYGAARTASRTSAPDPAKVHILEPGDEPLTDTAAEIDEQEPAFGDDDDESYTEAPLTETFTVITSTFVLESDGSLETLESGRLDVFTADPLSPGD